MLTTIILLTTIHTGEACGNAMREAQQRPPRVVDTQAEIAAANQRSAQQGARTTRVLAGTGSGLLGIGMGLWLFTRAQQRRRASRWDAVQ